MTIRTCTVKLRTTESQLDSFKALLAQAKDAYNLCSEVVDEKKLRYSRVNIHNECYDMLRAKFPLLSSQQVIRVQCDVCAAYKSRKANGNEDGEIPHKKHLSMTLDKRLYDKLTSTSIMLSGIQLGKRERFEFVGYERLTQMFRTYLPKDPTLFVRDGVLWLAIPFDVPERPLQNDNALGVDLGMKRLFVTSEGKSFVDKDYLAKRRKVRYLKRCLLAKGTKGAKRHLKNLKNRERKQSKDMIERATSALLKSSDASTLVLEDLKNLKKKTSKTTEGFKRTKHNNAMSQVPFHKFKERLTQKAALVGRQVITVSPAFTSQTDSRTNKRDGQRKGCRYYCPDRVVLDADWNAAVNIALRSKLPTSSTPPIDGGLVPLVGRHQSTCRYAEGL